MRILAINQFFWPDTAATGQLLTDLSRAIDPGAHSITVLCGPVGYGEHDTSPAPQAEILRSSAMPFSRGQVERVASYASFFVNAGWRSLLVRKPDVVLTLTTPPLISLLGTLLKALRGSRHFIWEMDVYPDIAVELKVLKRGSVLTRLIGSVADFSRKRADAIIALDDDMKKRLVARGIPEHKILVCENWADGDEIFPMPFESGPLTIQYSGNFGLAHESDTIFQVVRQLRGDSRFRFVFVGGGARRQHLEKFCRDEGIQTVEFEPYASRLELGTSLGKGHLGLVTQLPETVGAVVPSKTYGIMAAGRPVLYIGPRDSATARMLEKHECGWQIEPGDVAGMTRLLEFLEHDRDLLRRAGARARSVFEQNYDTPIGVSRILSILGILETHQVHPRTVSSLTA